MNKIIQKGLDDIVNITTSKIRAVCEAAGVKDIEDAPEAINKLKGWVQSSWRHIKGAVLAIPLSDDDIDDVISSLMKKSGKGNRL